MFSIFLKLIFFTVLLIVSACHPQQNITPPPAPDYSRPIYWYGQTAEAGIKPVDIFYVYPTLGLMPTDADGQPLLLSDITQQEQRQAALGNQRFNQEVYAATDYNFYAPFYRQTTMHALQNIDDADMKEQLRRVAAADIAEAFDYYMTHFNQGRPFILLGHSQGSSVLLQLLKNHINNKDFNQMVAAYLFGWQITQQELDEFPARLKPARGAEDTGVVVMFNSLTHIDAKSPFISQSVVCINPLNWKTDGTMAGRDEHLGIVRYNKEKGHYDTIPHFTGAYIEDHYLICPDVDAGSVFQEALGELFPLGNLHFMDSWLYALNLKANMAKRVASFQKR
jgi:hypothetical protein